MSSDLEDEDYSSIDERDPKMEIKNNNVNNGNGTGNMNDLSSSCREEASESDCSPAGLPPTSSGNSKLPAYANLAEEQRRNR